MPKRFRNNLILWGLLLTIFMAGVFKGHSIAEMYKWVDENGVAHFSDTPPGDAANNPDLETLPTYTTPENNEYPQNNGSKYNEDNRSNLTHTVQKSTWVKHPTVELYTTSWCPWCKKAKDFFRSRGIAFVAYDIEKDKAAARRKAQIDPRQGVPFAVINGKGIHGYLEKAYLNALKHEWTNGARQ